MQLFWLLIFTTLAKKDSFFSRISVAMKKIHGKILRKEKKKNANEKKQLLLENVLFSQCFLQKK